MIESIIKFINSEVIIERETVKTLYLSDGTHWNKSSFHKNRSLINAFITHEVNKDPKIKLISKNINRIIEYKKQQKAKQLEDINKKWNEEFKNKTEEQIMLSLSTNTLNFGKYKGQRVCDVFKKYPFYFDYLKKVETTFIFKPKQL